jgi:hypothetical protein
LYAGMTTMIFFPKYIRASCRNRLATGSHNCRARPAAPGGSRAQLSAEFSSRPRQTK